MVIALGQFSMIQLLSDFKLMALNRNELHELNRKNCNYLHDSGWGIVLGKSGSLEEFYKKDVACWKDPRFHEYYNTKPDFVIVHARKASRGSPINLSFTHPFEREGWYFCHNGTINQFLAEDKSDSEEFFDLLLSKIKKPNEVKEAIRKAINEIKEYTALNFILANKAYAYILVKYLKYPRYYSMKYLQNEHCFIVSSEILPNFQGKWEKIANNTLLKLDISNRAFEIISIE
jgi:predicted glutamine amidotransferase